MITSQDLRGVMPALPTPIGAGDAVDAGAVRALLAWLTEAGIDGVLPVGGTGENGSLARAERNRMVALCAEALKGGGPVIPGILDPGFHDALQSGREFADHGADALLLVTPYYTNPTQTGIRDYYLRYADASPLPVLIYEIPYRTRIAIAPETLHELSRHPNIIGMKACNTDMYHFLQVVAGVDDSFAVLSGEDSLFPLHMAAGARGGMLVTANLVPRAWRAIFDAASAGDTAGAIRLHRSLIPLMNLSFSETNPGPMKSVMDLIGVNAPDVLLPLVPPAEPLVKALRDEVTRQLAISESGTAGARAAAAS